MRLKNFAPKVVWNKETIERHSARAIEKANNYLAEHNPDRALEKINNALRLDPENANLFHTKGTIYLKSDRYDLALDNFQQALEKGLRSQALYIHIGEAYSYKKQYPKATLAFEAALDVSSSDQEKAEALNKKGMAHNANRQWTDAWLSFYNGRTLDPEGSKIYKKSEEEAEKHLEPTVALPRTHVLSIANPTNIGRITGSSPRTPNYTP